MVRDVLAVNFAKQRHRLMVWKQVFPSWKAFLLKALLITSFCLKLPLWEIFCRSFDESFLLEIIIFDEIFCDDDV